MCEYKDQNPEDNSGMMENNDPETGREPVPVEHPEEYRRSPAMREQRDRYYDYREENTGNSEGGRYSYDSRSNDYREERSTYGEENRSSYSEDGGRYSYNNTDRSTTRSTYGKRSSRKSGGRVIAIIIVFAILVGGMIGAACWSIGRLVSASVPAVGTSEGTAPAAISEETEAGDQSGSVLENPGESVIPSAPVGENSEDSVLITDIPDVVDMCMPSIVAISTKYVYENYSTYGYNPFYGYYGNNNGGTYEATGAGSGIIIGDDGEELWVVTNNHVIADSEEVTVTFNDEETVTAYIKGTDEDNDLAVVGVKLADMKDSTKESIRSIQMGDSESLRLGETVIAIGNALGIGQSVTSGILSAKDRDITTSEGATLKTLQIDAAINPGNSGGALLNSKGQLIGINVAKGVDEDVEGMGYAIPISNAKDIIQNLTTMKPRVPVSEDKYPYLGVELKDMNSSYTTAYNIPEGILVYTVTAGGPAEKAGMLTQDIITKMNGVSVSSYDKLKSELQYYEAGTEITVTVQRLENGTYVEKDLKVTLGLKSDYVKEEETAAADNNNGGGSFGGSGNQGGFSFSFPGGSNG